MMRAMLTTALMLVLSAEAMAQTPEVVQTLEQKLKQELEGLRKDREEFDSRTAAIQKKLEVNQLAAKIEELNAQIVLLQKKKIDEASQKAKAEARYKAAADAAVAAKAAEKAAEKAADKPQPGKSIQMQVVWNKESTDEVVTLNRRTFKLPKAKLDALSAFLSANVKGVVLETKVEGDTMTVTTTPETMKTLSGLVDLMNGGKKLAIFQAAPKVNLGDLTGQIELQLSTDSLNFGSFDVSPVLESAPKVWKVITGETKAVPATPVAPKPPVEPKPPTAPEAPKVRVIVPKPPAAPEKPSAPAKPVEEASAPKAPPK